MTKRIPISIVIPTKDEEANLAATLESVEFADEVVVFDSGSTDRTVDIATAAGLRVVTRPFDNFATHKNWAIDKLELRHGWMMFLDADERVTPELAAEISDFIHAPGDAVAAYVARKNFFQGRWIRHCGMYPDWQLRIFSRGHARYEERLVHEHMHVMGATVRLRSPLIHHDYKGLARFIDRHNTYSSMEAAEALRALGGLNAPGVVNRRRRMKNFAYRYLPLRPLFAFAYMFFLRLGFLDGQHGLRYCILRAIYEYQIDLKIQELRALGSDSRSPRPGSQE